MANLVELVTPAGCTVVLVVCIYAIKLAIDNWLFVNLPTDVSCPRPLLATCAGRACMRLGGTPCDTFGLGLPTCGSEVGVDNCRGCDAGNLFLCLVKRRVAVWVRVELAGFSSYSSSDTWMLFYGTPKDVHGKSCSESFKIDDKSRTGTCIEARYPFANRLILKIRRGGTGDWLTVATYANVWALAPGYLEGRRMMLLFTVWSNSSDVRFTNFECSKR